MDWTQRVSKLFSIYSSNAFYAAVACRMQSKQLNILASCQWFFFGSIIGIRRRSTGILLHIACKIYIFIFCIPLQHMRNGNVSFRGIPRLVHRVMRTDSEHFISDEMMPTDVFANRRTLRCAMLIWFRSNGTSRTPHVHIWCAISRLQRRYKKWYFVQTDNARARYAAISSSMSRS